ncbi:MAG: sugar phosphate isomerase/epimerase family protein [bacterium]|nr:sugar phosphate isomerase/epimerase family protein [bacterium]
MIHIAVQEDMLPGRSMVEKFEHAKALGVQGIEFWGRGLPFKVEQIVDAMDRTGIRAAMVNHGRQGRILDSDPLAREQGLDDLRQSIMCAADLRAAGVVFVPHFFGPLMPDLAPYLSAVELEAEMLHTHLRTLSDYADAMGVTLYVEPINRYETHFLNRLEQAAKVARRINHPRVKIVADLFHMALEETDMAAAIRDHADVIGHVHLADSNRRLPGQGLIDFRAMADALHAMAYSGWAAFECGQPGDNAPAAAQYLADLPASLALLRGAGWG